MTITILDSTRTTIHADHDMPALRWSRWGDRRGTQATATGNTDGVDMYDILSNGRGTFTLYIVSKDPSRGANGWTAVQTFDTLEAARGYADAFRPYIAKDDTTPRDAERFVDATPVVMVDDAPVAVSRIIEAGTGVTLTRAEGLEMAMALIDAFKSGADYAQLTIDVKTIGDRAPRAAVKVNHHLVAHTTFEVNVY